VDPWRAGAITCCDVGDMAIGYVACGAIMYCDVGDMAMEYVEFKSGTGTWHIDTWHIDKSKSIGGTYRTLRDRDFQSLRTRQIASSNFNFNS
jgi:hypothetical protein